MMNESERMNAAMMIMSGNEDKLTAEQKEEINQWNLKYSLVRYVYMEKMKADGKNLVNFHFSPGDNFLNVPVFDMVQSLINMNNAPSKIYSEIPHTGKEKLDLQEIELED